MVDIQLALPMSRASVEYDPSGTIVVAREATAGFKAIVPLDVQGFWKDHTDIGFTFDKVSFNFNFRSQLWGIILFEKTSKLKWENVPNKKLWGP